MTASGSLRVAALTGGVSVPSARFRVRQLIAPLAAAGIAVEEWPSLLSMYPPRARALRPLWLAGNVLQRLPQVLLTRRYGAVLLQRELISTLYSLEGLTNRPRVLDVDDAIWLHPRGGFAGRLAASCDAVICGNGFLADYFSRFNRRIEVIPTAVDTDFYTPAATRPDARHPVVGWVGTSGNLPSLYAIEPALAAFMKQVPGACLKVMADRPPAFRSLPPARVEFVPWSRAGEAGMIRGLTVGIMPLEDSDWARGKCGYKMLTYMSAAVPVVVSPVGVNREILARGECGIGAATPEEWTEALGWLCANPDRAHALGERGREIAAAHYSIAAVAPRVARLLREVAGAA